MQNVVLVLLILVVAVIAMEATRWAMKSRRRRSDDPHHNHHTRPRETSAAPVSSTGVSTDTAVPPSLLGQPWNLIPNNLFLQPNVGAQIPALPPFNQITHGVPDEWTYSGYVSPKTGTKPGKAVRYPLYVRQNLYQKNGYDYYVVDDSRNRVRINLELPRGVYQLWSGDEVEIDGEVGKWVVTIDVPPDTTWQRGFPFLPRF